jgi:Spy/CpxP family protein refolding chaperone
MKKLVLILISTYFLIYTVASAGPQDNNDYWGHGFGMGYAMGCYDAIPPMMGDLKITNNQAKTISAIDNKYRSMYYDNRGNFNKIDSLRKEHRKEIEGVLNDSQKSKFNSAYNNRWGGWGRGYGRHHMGNYYGQEYGMGFCTGLYSTREYMKSNLELNTEQEKKIADIDLKYRDLYDKNRGNYAKIDELRVEHRQSIENVLTPEQRKKFNEAYDDRWRGRGRGGMMRRGMMGY